MSGETVPLKEIDMSFMTLILSSVILLNLFIYNLKPHRICGDVNIKIHRLDFFISVNVPIQGKGP
jgi:hypothetical protein